MNKNWFFSAIMSVLLFACGDTKHNELMEIPVDIEQNIPFRLSEITEELIIIEPELTDESLINPDRIIRMLLYKDHVIIVERKVIHVFDINGKFIRAIGSVGQGPGEFINVRNVAIDENNKRLFVNTTSKLICYDLDGFFLKESSNIHQNTSAIDLNYINNELLLVAEQIGVKDEKGKFNHLILYRLNVDLQIIDSCTIRDTYFERPGTSIHPYEYFILHGNSTIYLYCSDIYIDITYPAEIVLRDTLYRFGQNQFFPELKLKFNNNGIDGNGRKFIQLFNIYRSSRYVFAMYNNEMTKNWYYFCYDTKTGKGHNMQDGYIDDINQIETRVAIRPLNANTEMFYYWHTHIKPDDLEEPNPTIYIGKLKK